MKRLNNKGFTLIEVLAVVVILSVLTAIMVPSVNYLIDMNKENNYNDMRDGFIQATKVLFSDYRYEVAIDGTCSSNSDERNILKVGDYTLTGSKVPIQVLVNENNVTVNESGNIVDPRDTEKILDLNNSYVLVKYQCNKKDFRYEIEVEQNGVVTDYLVWK